MGNFRTMIYWTMPFAIVAILGAARYTEPWATLQESPPSAPVAIDPRMTIGTNLDGLAYWNPGLPVLDLMKSASRWLPQTDAAYDTGEVVPQDAQGWVERLPTVGSGVRYTSALVNVLHDNPAAAPNARYVVLYAGTGALEVVGVGGSAVVSRAPGRIVLTASDAGGMYLRIAATGDAQGRDILRDIRVLREDHLPLYEAGQTFNPDFLDKLRGFRVLRFMDWMNTNVLFDRAGRPIDGEQAIAAAPVLDWADRPTPGDRRWGDGSHGVPVEAMVEIANRTGAEPWFNMPVNASDDYVRGFATYVRTHLRADRAVHVEFSNEVWNWMFPQARYAKHHAQAVFGPGANWMEWYGMRTAQVGTIWKTVFGEPPKRSAMPGRIRVVYNTQFGWKGLETHGLDTDDWRDAAGHHLRASDWFDDYAVTGYYDGTMNTDERAPIVRSWWADADGGYGRAVRALAARISDFNTPLYRYHGEVARRHGLTLVTYESGFGESTPPSQHDEARYTDFLAGLQRRPEFYRLEMQNYRAFQAAGGRLYMNFGIIGTPTKWGNWSVLESVGQASSPRYRALRDWISAHPPARAETDAPAKLSSTGGTGRAMIGFGRDPR